MYLICIKIRSNRWNRCNIDEPAAQLLFEGAESHESINASLRAPSYANPSLMVKASGWQSFDRHFEPYPRAIKVAPLWCSVGSRSESDGRHPISPCLTPCVVGMSELCRLKRILVHISVGGMDDVLFSRCPSPPSVGDMDKCAGAQQYLSVFWKSTGIHQ
jgi:hypothetical protein